MKQNDTIKLLKKLVFILIFMPCLMYSQTVTWQGDDMTDPTDWNTAENWDTDAVPTASDNVIISIANPCVINSTTAAFAKVLVVLSTGSLTIESGGSLIADGAVGDITYQVSISDDNTRLMSSPVVGEEYGGMGNTWIADNDVGVVTHMGDTLARISTYDNTRDPLWQAFPTSNPTATFESGVGYAIGLTAGGTPGGTVSFEGEYLDDDIMRPVTVGNGEGIANNNNNFIGNPYPSYFDIETFIETNTSILGAANQAVYVRRSGETTYFSFTSGQLHPGQGFFIRTNLSMTTGQVSITQAMQRPVTQFFRPTSTDPSIIASSIKVMLSDGTITRDTQIDYVEGKTKSLDPRFDLGMFNQTSSDLTIFTHLIEDNEGIAFGKQTLPNSDLESMAVPVGVKADAGQEITFSVEALDLPTDLKVFLEDKLTNTFTRLDKANTNYKVTLSEGLNGVGRFYLHTSKSVSDATLNTVSIYKSDISTLRIVGLPQGNKTVKLFNILGKQVLNTSFDDDAKDISLPKLVPSVYIVDVQTEIGKLNKKIILE